MIIHKCDICKKDVLHLDSIVLYKKSFDYCRNCKMEAERIKEEFKKEYDCEYAILNNKLKSKEKQFIYELKQKNTEDILLNDEKE